MKSLSESGTFSAVVSCAWCREFARMAKRVIKLSQQEGQQVQLSCCFKLSLCSKLLQRKSNAAIDVCILIMPCQLYPVASLTDRLPLLAKTTALNIICCPSDCVSAHVQKESLVSMAEWCRRYAQINSVGLRKVPAYQSLCVLRQNPPSRKCTGRPSACECQDEQCRGHCVLCGHIHSMRR